MTIRVEILTKKYLFSADGPIEMAQARKDSYKDSYKEAAAASSVKKVINNVKGTR